MKMSSSFVSSCSMKDVRRYFDTTFIYHASAGCSPVGVIVAPVDYRGNFPPLCVNSLCSCGLHARFTLLGHVYCGSATSLIDFRACGTACSRNKAQAQCIHNGGSFSRPCRSSVNLHLGATNGINRAGLCPKASVGMSFTRRSNFRPTCMLPSLFARH